MKKTRLKKRTILIIAGLLAWTAVRVTADGVAFGSAQLLPAGRATAAYVLIFMMAAAIMLGAGWGRLRP